MHARVVGALLCLCSLALLTGAIRPANAANAINAGSQGPELSAEEMEAAQALRAERIPQAAAQQAKEKKRRGVGVVEGAGARLREVRLGRAGGRGGHEAPSVSHGVSRPGPRRIEDGPDGRRAT